MTEKKQINIRVPTETKDEWDHYAEKHHGSLTRLITTAVTREMEGAHESTGEASGATSEAVNGVQNAVDSLENTVRDMDKRLQSMRVSIEESSPDISIESAVRETLNEAPTEELADETETNSNTISTEPMSEAVLSAEEVSARLGGDLSTINGALEKLQRRGEVTEYHGPDGPVYLLTNQ